jgi:prevent-host-death family protein
MRSVSAREANQQFSRLLGEAANGEEIVITRRGKPAVRLVPVEEARQPRRPGALKGKLKLPESFFDPLPDDIIDAFYESKIFPDEK